MMQLSQTHCTTDKQEPETELSHFISFITSLMFRVVIFPTSMQNFIRNAEINTKKTPMDPLSEASEGIITQKYGTS